MINFAPSGQWQDSPDYREGMVNRHSSPIGALARVFDPTTYIPGLNQISNPIHEAGTGIIEYGNTQLSPIVGGIQKLEHLTNPVSNYLNKNVPIVSNVNEFIREKPVDAAAIAAATFFSGGAASGSLGTAAAPAASGGAGAAGGAGAVTGSAGAAAITPAFTSGAIAAPTATGATYSGLGTLGAAGTQAAGSLITPALASYGANAGLFGKTADIFNKTRDYSRYARNLNQPMPRDTTLDNQNADLSNRILNENQGQNLQVKKPKPLNIKRITNAIAQRNY